VSTAEKASWGLLNLLVLLCLQTTLCHAAPQLAWEARHNFGLLSGTHQVVAMTLDNAGDIIIAGNKANASGDLDYAVLKYSQSGTQLWARTYSSGLQANDQLWAMAVDSNGNVYVTGTSRTVKYNRDGLLQCNKCREQFTVTVGTVFERSKIALNKWSIHDGPHGVMAHPKIFRSAFLRHLRQIIRRQQIAN